MKSKFTRKEIIACRFLHIYYYNIYVTGMLSMIIGCLLMALFDLWRYDYDGSFLHPLIVLISMMVAAVLFIGPMYVFGEYFGLHIHENNCSFRDFISNAEQERERHILRKSMDRIYKKLSEFIESPEYGENIDIIDSLKGESVWHFFLSQDIGAHMSWWGKLRKAAFIRMGEIEGTKYLLEFDAAFDHPFTGELAHDILGLPKLSEERSLFGGLDAPKQD